MIYSGGDKKNRAAMIILDGWGIAPAWGGNAIALADTRNFNKIWRQYPSTSLKASGSDVGLPVNSPGNSEAGHLNIGAGKVVHQDITLIDEQMENGDLDKNLEISAIVNHVAQNKSAIHLMGMLSKAGTHSHIKHLYKLLNVLKNKGVKKASIHLFTDGRDSDPYSGLAMVRDTEEEIKKIGLGTIVSLMGRFFVMDRDNRWGRIARAYNLLVKGEGNIFPSASKAISDAYSKGQTDEFIEPRLIGDNLTHPATISDNDAVMLFNFRSDRSKEIVSAFLSPRVDQFIDRKKLKNLYFASFVVYDEENLARSIFKPVKIDKPLASVWSTAGLRQFHIAETEKYPHVTYFINGGREKPFLNEERLMVHSPKNVKTYDYKPEMSAIELTKKFISIIRKNRFDGLVINYANADMVGHTGNFESTKIAVSTVDKCLGKIIPELLKKNYMIFVFADHGNAEQMTNPRSGQPDTGHTTNPVPFCLVSNEYKNIKFVNDGILANIAPTVLETMGIEKPIEMTNSSLIIKEANA